MQLQFIVALLVVLALCGGCAGTKSNDSRKLTLGGNDRGKSTNFTNSSNQPKSKGKLNMFSSGNGSQTKNQNSFNFGGPNTSTYPRTINFGSQTMNPPQDNLSSNYLYPISSGDVVSPPMNQSMLNFESQTTDQNSSNYDKLPAPKLSGQSFDTKYKKEMEITPFQQLGYSPYFTIEGCKRASFHCKGTTVNVDNNASPPRIGHAFEGLHGLQNVSHTSSNFSSTPMDQSKNDGNSSKKSSSGSKWLWRK
uniref:Uncharacterized protein n=1 Tax=Globodera rostochiensis TaxID=31243 RepID=A0A914HAC2_GLORO